MSRQKVGVYLETKNDRPTGSACRCPTMRYRVPVPQDGEAKLNYRVRVRF